MTTSQPKNTLPQHQQQQDDDDIDDPEWEYEYSTTETETYYLTLDLSIPEFTRRTETVGYSSRGGYYRTPVDTHVSHVRRKASSPTAEAGKAAREGVRAGAGAGRRGGGGGGGSRWRVREGHGHDDDDDDEEENEGDEDGNESEHEDGGGLDDYEDYQKQGADQAGEHNDDNNGARGGQDDDDDHNNDEDDDDDDTDDDSEQLARNIQILDLHSHNPIISYRGRIFEGRWAENVGTEVLFASSDPPPPPASSTSTTFATASTHNTPLPYLRSLSNGMFLLAASASRILTTEKVLHPREAGMDSDASDTAADAATALSYSADPVRLERFKEENKIMLHIGTSRRYAARDRQARFLEDLMAIKKQKGQRDEVTVYALPAANKDFNDNAHPYVRPRTQRSLGGGGGGGERAARKRARRALGEDGAKVRRKHHSRGWVEGPDGVKRRLRHKKVPNPWSDSEKSGDGVGAGGREGDEESEMSDDAETEEEEEEEDEVGARRWDDLSGDEEDEDDEDDDDGERPPPRKKKKKGTTASLARQQQDEQGGPPGKKRGRPNGSGKKQQKQASEHAAET